MEYLVRTFWKPIHRFLRSRLQDEQTAEDATQEFFLKFIERDLFGSLDPAKGRFRTFLYHIARQFLIDIVRSRQAAKRGGDREQIQVESIELADAQSASPDEEFDRQWWLSVVNEARRAVKKFATVNEKPGVYRAFRLLYFGTDRPEKWSLKDIAAEIDVSVPQVNNYLHKARGLYAAAIRESVARYCRSPEEAEAELSDLAAFLERHRVQGPPPSTFHPERNSPDVPDAGASTGEESS